MSNPVSRPTWRQTFDAEVSQRKTAEAAREYAEAELHAALDALSSLVLHVQRVGGYMEHDDQATLREARAMLARHGR